MNVVNVILEKDGMAMNSDLDAKFGRERARIDTDQDEGRRGRLPSYADSKGVHDRALHLLLEQVSVHGGTNNVLPDPIKTVDAEGSQLLGFEVRLRTCGPHPDVGIGASDKAGLGGKAIEVMLCLDLGWNVGSIGRRVRDGVASHGYEDGGMDVLVGLQHPSPPGWAPRGSRHPEGVSLF